MRAWLFMLTLCGLVATTACGPDGSAPVLQPVEDHVVAVNEEIVLVLSGSDSDGDELFYSFESDVPGIAGRAAVSRLPVGAGEFRWTPEAGDVGVWYFDFTASDGKHDATISVRIEVRSAVGDNSAPRFLHPQGTGTTLDLDQRQCIEIDIEIDDADSTGVVIAAEQPIIAGSELVQIDGLTAQWSWCPTAAQIAADDRYTLTLSADDRDNPKTRRPYLVVLRKPFKPDCPGDGPVITHLPSDESTLAGLTIAADISDDQGLKREPLLYWSTTPPTSPPDLSQMNQVVMLLIDGSMADGVWAADVPNPVALGALGDTAELHYLITATDDDDPTGDCDHRSVAPETDSFSMTVTHPGGSGGAGLCAPCTADVQCGSGQGDLCVRVGSAGDGFCLEGCTSDASCQDGYECSAAPVESVQGAMARQCVPISNSCQMGGATCDDDDHEDNDNLEESWTQPLLEAGTESLVSCPGPGGVGDDEDWFEIWLQEDSDITVGLVGGDESDLDLALYDIDGALITSSASFDSVEDLSACLASGFYYVRVNAWGAAENPYTLSYSASPGVCDTAQCSDDDSEPDDSAATARAVTAIPTHLDFDQTICTGDDDWYAFEVWESETIVVDLTFDQGSSDQDLDIHLYDDGVVDLTPCSVDEPFDCQTDNGQSGSSNEHFEYTVPATGCLPCTHYVVVRGYDGSENDYDISIGIE